jgi:hypothetical protein
MDNAEVIVNLWYVADSEGLIYSLRAKPYLGAGSDADKLHFLRERALLDYLVAEPFSIPERFHIRVGIGVEFKVMEVAHLSMLQTLDSPIALFEDALKSLESRFPPQSNMRIPQDPLVCTTTLIQNEQGVLEPQTSRLFHY